MGKLIVLMVTAFIDMMGVLMVIPLLPFYAKRMLGHGPLWTALNYVGFGGEGAVMSLLVISFAVAQLVSSPFWGRISDRYGRRPALLIGMGASVIAYVILAFAGSLEMLFLCRIVQGAGGGTVGVIPAYVADATKPADRSKALGWLSAATNAGVTIGPVIGSWSMGFGPMGPGLAAASLSAVNMVFAFFYLSESHDTLAASAAGKRMTGSREALTRVLSHASDPASRHLDLRDHDGRVPGDDDGACPFSRRQVRSDGEDHRLFLHLCWFHFRRHARTGAREDGRPLR